MRFNITNTQNSAEVASSFEEINKKYDNMVSEFEKQKAAIKKEFGNTFKSFCEAFFVLVPEVKSISWAQYTPYFNDGDACTFSVCDLSFANFIPEELTAYLADNDGYDKDNGEWALSSYSFKRSTELSSEKAALCQKFSQLINNNEDFVEDLFGDHIIVQVTAEGVETAEYDHD